jgi:hypothetical protein
MAYVFAFHDAEAIHQRLLARIARRTGLRPRDFKLIALSSGPGYNPQRQVPEIAENEPQERLPENLPDSPRSRRNIELTGRDGSPSICAGRVFC